MKRQSSADAAAAFRASRERRAERIATKPAKAPIPVSARTVNLRLPVETYEMLVRHCQNYGIRPQTYIRRMLEMSKLSRGGV